MKDEDQKQDPDMCRAGEEAACFPSRRGWICNREHEVEEIWGMNILRNQCVAGKGKIIRTEVQPVVGLFFFIHRKMVYILELTSYCIFMHVVNFAMLPMSSDKCI